MDFNMEWTIICRVCLQEGEMRSIYEKDERDMIICDKIMVCSDLKIKPNQNLPEQICLKCLEELEIAFSFRNNCESSNAVLESFVKSGAIVNELVCSVKGKVYKYDPPEGLDIKRIRKSAPEKFESVDIEAGPVLIAPKIETDLITYDDCSIASSQMEIEYQMNTDEYSDEISIKLENIKDIEKSKKKTVTKTRAARKDGTAIGSKKTKYDGGEKPLSICELCGNVYRHKHALETHMRRHRNEKPFACEICGRAFVLNVELTCHMRTHTGQKPYACRHCDRRFSDFGSRIKHERSHTGERPYKCETCGKAFAYSYGLSSHMLTHTGEKRFECEKCGKRFTKKHHLTNHLKTHEKHEIKMMAQKALIEADNLKKISDRARAAVLLSRPNIEQYEGDEFEIIDDKSLIIYSPAHDQSE